MVYPGFALQRGEGGVDFLEGDNGNCRLGKKNEVLIGVLSVTYFE